MRGVVIYGPPGAGKDTITNVLCEIDSQYVLFRRLKVGNGRTLGYRMANSADVDSMRTRGEIIWENARYGALYVIDLPTLVGQLAVAIPVLHLGQLEAIEAVKKSLPQVQWLVVGVSCPREVARKRIAARGTGDIEARMRAWDETERLRAPDLSIETDRLSPDEAARLILRRMSGACPGSAGARVE